MPFRAENLKMTACAGNNAQWYYATSEDALATVVASGYFSAVASKLRAQDVVVFSATDSAGQRRVSSATGVTPVTVAALG